MKKMLALSSLAFSLLFASCGGNSKTVIIWASGQVSVNDHEISLEPGNRHTEIKIPVNGDKLTFKGANGNTDFNVPEGGVYILNLKNDTVVGSYQRVGEGSGETKISKEVLRQRIDSLNQLMAGTNVTEAARNFNIPPKSIKRITGNAGSQIIGPFMKMPTSFEGGKEHEIYKFYTNKEVTEIVNRLKPLSEEAPASE